jgi:hypothetical protein
MLSTSIAKDPMAVFLYAVKSPESKRQYPRRFKMFLDFLDLGGYGNVSKSMFVGMDVHKNYLQVAVLDEKGKILNNSRVDNNMIKVTISLPLFL